MRHMRILWVALLAAGLVAAALAPAMAQDSAIITDHQAIRTALEAKDFTTVWEKSHDIMMATAKHDPATLTGPELYAISVAHYYLVAEALDAALKCGGLTQEQTDRANAMRARILGLDRTPTPAAVTAPPVAPLAPVAATADVPAVRVISHGQQINIADYIAPGRITIFDFFSEFCPPCRKLSPQLEKLAQARPDLALVKVDINRAGIQGIDWQSPVARQFSLQGIPHLKVYGADGKLMAEGDNAFQLVMGWCNGAQ